MNVDVKQYSTFGSDNTLAQFSSAIGNLKSSGLALSAFNLIYGQNTSHFVEAARVQAKASGTPADNRFRFTTEASLHDSSRNNAISAATFAASAAFASGSGQPGLEFLTGPVSSISKPVPFNFSQPINNAYVALGGFSFSFGSGNNHHIREITAQASINDKSDKKVDVLGRVFFSDGSGHSGEGPIQALVIGQLTGDATRFEEKPWTTGQGEVSVTLNNVSRPINQAVVFITRFSLKYTGSGDHEVRQILLDAGNNSLNIVNEPGSRRATIKFLPKLIMTDGNNTAAGELTLLVMAVPA
jgi:hypothetical protein